MPSRSWRVRRTPAVSQRLPSWSRKLSAISCRPFSISLSWILRCFLISSGVWNWAGRPVSSCRKRTSWRRAAYTWLPVMRPPVLRHSSIARSTAQSECWELSTGTKISRYTDTSLSRAGRVCEPLNRLSSKPETENATVGLVGGLAGYQLPTFRVPHCYRVHRARIARPQQPLPLYGLRIQEHRHGLVVQFETLGSLLHAVPEPDALIPVDHHAQPMDPPLIQPLHMPSRPSSVRAVSMSAGVISAIPRSFA